MVMTADTATLPDAFEDCQMVEIDGLHSFDFSLDDQTLSIICMDGRVEKRWSFTLEQVKAATLIKPCKAGHLPMTRANTAWSA